MRKDCPRAKLKGAGERGSDADSGMGWGAAADHGVGWGEEEGSQMGEDRGTEWNSHNADAVQSRWRHETKRKVDNELMAGADGWLDEQCSRLVCR